MSTQDTVKSGNIFGVKIIHPEINHDDRGSLYEAARSSSCGTAINQITVTRTDPGIIKASHSHRRQTDIWLPIAGRARVVLFDLRRQSPTAHTRQIIIVDGRTPVTIVIPPGVAHGYQVLGRKEFVMVYATSHEYNPSEPDEQRTPPDDSLISNGGKVWRIINR